MNYEAVDWLNGRSANQPLAAVITEVCEAAGLDGVQTDAALGVVRGYGLTDVTSARAVLQPMLQAASVDAVEREGILTFLRRTGQGAVALPDADFALSEDQETALVATRLSEAETQDQLRLTYLAAESDFAARTVSASLPDARAEKVAQSELPLALTSAEAAGMAERWLMEARIARDTLRFALPPSRRGIGAGSVVSVADKLYRIDRCELTTLQTLEAVRLEPAVYRDPQVASEATGWQPYQAPTPPYPVYLDLPLLTGNETPHAPHIAVAASPWPGQVAVWSSATEAGFTLNTLIAQSAMVAVSETALPAGATSRWEKGAPLRIRFAFGVLSAAEELAVLAGANAIAIGDGSPDAWEIIQFQSATLVAPGTYDIHTRLRGQMGTDGVMPDLWPAGSTVVVLDSSLRQIDLQTSARGLARNYRVGAANRPYDAPEVVAQTHAFQGVGLRPYAVCHARKRGILGQDIAVTWVRRTRIDGDSWQSAEVPLGEDAETYRLHILTGTTLLREVITSAPEWTYTVAMQATDGATALSRIEVAQVSASFGAGPARAMALG